MIGSQSVRGSRAWRPRISDPREHTKPAFFFFFLGRLRNSAEPPQDRQEELSAIPPFSKTSFRWALKVFCLGFCPFRQKYTNRDIYPEAETSFLYGLIFAQAGKFSLPWAGILKNGPLAIFTLRLYLYFLRDIYIAASHSCKQDHNERLR